MVKRDALFKVVIFGDGGVGKTTLVNRYLTGVFTGNSSITIGIDFHLKKIEIEGKSIELQIWDFAGEERFRFLLPSYVRGAKGGIFMYDITRYFSLKNLSEWLEVFKKGIGKDSDDIPIVMVGGKLDLEDKRAVKREDAIDIAKKNNFYGFVECSAKTGQNVEVAFVTLTQIMMEKSNLL
ncbi:MAG: Rab family GTPase [Promethearchaeota archaeon]